MGCIDTNDLSLDLLLEETLVLTEHLRLKPAAANQDPKKLFLPDWDDMDYLPELADNMIQSEAAAGPAPTLAEMATEVTYPEGPGVIYKIDNGASTFCVRGYSVASIKQGMEELLDLNSSKRLILKLDADADIGEASFFPVRTFELAEAIREQIINRRFPHMEDAVCNLSDPGFSWWMDTSESRFEIFFRSHGINRAEKYIQLGPIGDGGVAALRMNQAKSLIRSSFPISEFSCDDKSFTVATLKPDHSSFLSFKNIFLQGINHTELENFPDNSIGRTLFYYFHELAIVRKFWIEVKGKLG